MQWALSAWAGNQERRIGWNGRLYTKEDIEEYYWPRTDIWDDLPHCAYQLSSYQQHLQSQSSASSQQQMPTWMTRTAAEDTHGWTRTAAGHWHRTIDASQPDAIDASQPDASRAINVVAPTTDSTIDSSQLALGSPEQPRAAQSSIEQTTSAHSSQEQPRPAPRHTPPVNPTIAPEIVPAEIVPARHLLSDGRNLRRRPVAQSIQNPPPPGPILEIQDMGAIRPIGVGPLLCHGISTGMWESVSDLCYVQSASAHVAPQHDRQETQETSPQGQLPVAAQSSQQQSLHPTTEANDAHVAACTTLSSIDASQLDGSRDALGSPTASIPPPTIHLCPPPTIHRIKLTPRKRDPTSETNDAHVGAIDAPQLDASRSSDDHALAPMPSRPCPDAHALVLHDNDQALAPLPQVVLTGVQLEAMRRVSGRAGKYACSQQRDLRAQLLLTGEYEHDLTYGDWPWWDVIRSLPQDLRTLLVGPGVTMFTFKLVVGEMDHNYVGKPNDSGERHVFHIRRADNVAHHLHFHKNGSLDDPVKSQHTVTLPTTLPIGCVIRQDDFTIDNYNGALQPVGFDEGFITGPIIGRREAALACTILLDACGGQGRAASVDVTDEFAFPWRRWLLHQTNTYLYAVFRPQNIVRVFIYRGLFDFDEFHRLIRDDDDIPKIACCLADGTFVRYYPRSRTKKAEILDNWPAVRLFHRPHHVTLPWNRMHDRA